jgi:hypothetical protein
MEDVMLPFMIRVFDKATGMEVRDAPTNEATPASAVSRVRTLITQYPEPEHEMHIEVRGGCSSSDRQELKRLIAQSGLCIKVSDL